MDDCLYFAHLLGAHDITRVDDKLAVTVRDVLTLDVFATHDHAAGLTRVARGGVVEYRRLRLF